MAKGNEAKDKKVGAGVGLPVALGMREAEILKLNPAGRRISKGRPARLLKPISLKRCYGFSLDTQKGT